MVAYFGTANADYYVGTSLADNIYRQGGNHTLFGEGGSDMVFGGAGNDLIFGGGGFRVYVKLIDQPSTRLLPQVAPLLARDPQRFGAFGQGAGQPFHRQGCH